MPIYAYRCADCGHAVEVLQKVSDAPLSECPSCHRPALVKQVTAAGFQLKGSGWYVTDFRNKKSTGSEAPKDKPADAAADAKAPAEGAAKPADSAKPADAPSPAASAPAPAPPPASSGS